MVIPIMVVYWLHCRLGCQTIPLQRLRQVTQPVLLRTMTVLRVKDVRRHKSRYAPQDSKATGVVGALMAMLHNLLLANKPQ